MAELTLHRLMKEAIWTHIQMWAPNAKMEYRLSNNKIADIHFGYKGEEFIVEVKTEYKYTYMEQALRKYTAHCNFLFMAFPAGSVPDSAFEDNMHWQRTRVDQLGIIETSPAGVVLKKLPRLLERKTAQ